uniref:Uncharacterized protein n=1 Tax=Vespula pensylvanica TaxID=30213 RepID=A0A834K2U0_VESPE|nr:hypothetical protein H0235_016330 [Vespula pensylvanica]
MQMDLGNLENSLAKSNRALDPRMNLSQNVNPNGRVIMVKSEYQNGRVNGRMCTFLLDTSSDVSLSVSALTGATRQQIQRQFCVLSRSTCFRLSRLYSERSTYKVGAFLETSGSGKRGDNCNLAGQPNPGGLRGWANILSIFEDFLCGENQQTDSTLVDEDFAIGSKTSKYERFCRKVDEVLSVSTLELEILDEKRLSKTRLGNIGNLVESNRTLGAGMNADRNENAVNFLENSTNRLGYTVKPNNYDRKKSLREFLAHFNFVMKTNY